jgi:hypothetical protein
LKIGKLFFFQFTGAMRKAIHSATDKSNNIESEASRFDFHFKVARSLSLATLRTQMNKLIL